MRHLALISLWACKASTPTPVTPTPEPVFCEGTTSIVYAPDTSTRLDAWPDRTFSEPDPSSPTGLRVQVTNQPWFEPLGELLQDVAANVDGMSGFGTQATLLLRFNGELGELPTVETSTTNTAILLVDRSTTPPTRVPFEASVVNDGRQLVVLPVGPLKTGHEHALVVTNDLLDDEGGCISPTPPMRSVLTGDATGPLAPPAAEVPTILEELDLRPDDVTAVLSFPTHQDETPFLDSAEQASERTQSWGPTSCSDDGTIRRCETSYEPVDFRIPGSLDPSSSVRSTVPVTFWLPSGASNAPLVVYGHGLGQNRLDGDVIAAQLVPEGFGLVGTDALFHGQHPTTMGVPDPTAFLGLDLSDGIAFDLERLQASFSQSTLERLQLVDLLASDADIEGLGSNAYDPDRLGYLGISLGGILGSGLIATSDDIDHAILAIAGGNFINIVRDNPQATQLEPILVNLAGSEENLEALFSVLQTAVDPVDPTLFAARVHRDRPFGGVGPHVLLPVAVEDEVVPFTAGRALARAYPLPHVGPVAVSVPGLTTAPAGISGNGPEGQTLGYFQYDRMTLGGQLQPSRHIMPASAEFTEQLRVWMTTWDATGTPEIADPFENLGTPEL